MSFRKSAKTILFESIRYFTGLVIPQHAVKLGALRVADIRPNVEDDPNTYIPAKVDAHFDARFKNFSGFMYRRLPLSLLSGTSELSVIAPNTTFKTSDILTQINVKYNALLSMDDVLELEYTKSSDITLVANPNSLAWLGSLDVPLQTGTQVDLVSTIHLPGFAVPI
jgi:hypothetical protein